MLFSLFSVELPQVVQQHLSYKDISYLTFEAVLEVVIICFAGFVAAKSGLLDLRAQKVISSLNVDLFTPCLVFAKLASSLSLQKMIDIIIIPIFYALSTSISYMCSIIAGKVLGLNEPELDFVTAMAVFGNSNSLPVSLTLSLAYSLPNILWDDIDADNSDKVASRGILYLLIFQQLGQILRWSWGYNKLLRKRSHEELNTYKKSNLSDTNETERLLYTDENELSNGYSDNTSSESVESNEIGDSSSPLSFSVSNSTGIHPVPSFALGNFSNNSNIIKRFFNVLFKIKNTKTVKGILGFMNPPLYAMLLSVVVASVPFLKNMFFGEQETFIQNTVTKAITQLGSVSIPLILIVLGSNLYPSKDLPPASIHYNRIIIGSLLSRMILPSMILLPIITLCVKFVKISILDDPIFLIVAFILTISPPAIQLSQITQINNIYQKEMAGVLFWGYVVLTLPTTIFIVVTSLEVLEWAKD